MSGCGEVMRDAYGNTVMAVGIDRSDGTLSQLVRIDFGGGTLFMGPGRARELAVLLIAAARQADAMERGK